MAQVSRPTDTNVRDADIERKLQLYGIFLAFKEGKMPTNAQADIALNSLLGSDLLSPDSKWNRKLSDEGRSLIKDAAAVVESAKTLWITKNRGNLLQEFLWHSSLVSESKNSTVEPVNTGDLTTTPGRDSATLYEDQDVVGGLKNLGTLIITNGQFRKLLNDFVILFRDMAGDVATNATDKLGNAAEQVRPSEEELSQIDESAPDNQWHDSPDSSKFDKYKGVFNKDSDEAKRYKQQAIDAKQQRLGQAKDYLSEKMPQERRDQIIVRLKKMVVEIQGHPEFQSAIDSLLDFLEKNKANAKDSMGNGSSQVKKVTENDHLQAAQTSLRTLVERFANDSSLDDLFGVANDLYAAAEKDEHLRSWFTEVDSYIRRVLKEKGYILEDQATRDYNKLYDRGREIFSKQYKGYGDDFTREFNYLIEQFRADPLNDKFGKDMDRLFKNLGTDGDDGFVFKPHLLKDITSVIIPEIFENVRYVPLPRIEYSDVMIDAVVENLIIESNNLFPNLIELHNQSVMRWGRSTYSDANFKHGSFTMTCKGIQCDLKDVSYYVKKKSGFPSLRDTGLADFYLGRDGLSFTISLSTATEKSPNNFFQVDNVNVKIQDLDVRLRRSRHKILFAFFRPLLMSIAKPAIKAVLQQQIKKSFNDLDTMAYQVQLEKKRIAHDVKNDPEIDSKPSIFSMYSEAVKNEMFKSKEKKAEANKKKPDREAKTNIAMTQHDSMFKNIVLPKGISSTKATKYKEMALSGERWTSPVFSIGSASVTGDISAPDKITRRDEKSGVTGATGTTRGTDTTGTTGTRGSGTGTNEKYLAAGAGATGAAAATTALGTNHNQSTTYEGEGVGQSTEAYDPGNTTSPGVATANSLPGLYEQGLTTDQTETATTSSSGGYGATTGTTTVNGTQGRTDATSMPGQYDDATFPTMRSKQTPTGVQPMRVSEKVEQMLTENKAVNTRIN